MSKFIIKLTFFFLLLYRKVKISPEKRMMMKMKRRMKMKMIMMTKMNLKMKDSARREGVILVLF